VLVAHATPFEQHYRETLGCVVSILCDARFHHPGRGFACKRAIGANHSAASVLPSFLDCFWLLGCACLIERRWSSSHEKLGQWDLAPHTRATAAASVAGREISRVSMFQIPDPELLGSVGSVPLWPGISSHADAALATDKPAQNQHDEAESKYKCFSKPIF